MTLDDDMCHPICYSSNSAIGPQLQIVMDEEIMPAPLEVEQPSYGGTSDYPDCHVEEEIMEQPYGVTSDYPYFHVEEKIVEQPSYGVTSEHPDCHVEEEIVEQPSYGVTSEHPDCHVEEEIVEQPSYGETADAVSLVEGELSARKNIQVTMQAYGSSTGFPSTESLVFTLVLFHFC
jgi:hypothetical protein